MCMAQYLTDLGLYGIAPWTHIIIGTAQTNLPWVEIPRDRFPDRELVIVLRKAVRSCSEYM